MQPAEVHNVSQRYSAFAEDEAKMHSETYAVWAAGVSEDDEVCQLISTLSPRERQPNLVFGVLRLACPELVEPSQERARPDEYQRFRTALIQNWSQLVALAANHHTQTNEAARIAALMPALTVVHKGCGKPLALVELGAAAGLVLHPQAWRYRYLDPKGTVLSSFDGGRSLANLDVRVQGEVELPEQPVPIDWRVGVDLNPVDLRRGESREWLRTLIWPGQRQRLARLDAALQAAADDPVLVIPRDLTAEGVLDEILGLVPADVHPVVFHCAVQAYLGDDARQRLSHELLERSHSGELSWISYEGATVISQIEPPASTQPGDFVVAVNGHPQYLADGHASWIRGLEAGPSRA